MIDIDLINGRRTSDIFGTSKYTYEIIKRLKKIQIHRIEYPQFGKSECIDGAIKRILYPFIVKMNINKNSIKHITNQDLAFLLNYIDLHPSIVTCYDLIPVAYYHKKSLYWHMNLNGMQKADHIITISEFSKREIIRLTGYPDDLISVIYPGVDTQRYYPKPDRSILTKFGISPEDFVILFVGSEEPRKNISILLKALYSLKKENPHIKLLKVGGAQMGGDRNSLLRLIHELKMENDVIFTGQVTEDELPKYYNAADLFVFPSLYEGFGMPPLEAMACGCPFLVANNSPINEIINNPELTINPLSVNDISKHIKYLLNDESMRIALIDKGKTLAKRYNWNEASQRTFDIYNVLNSNYS